MAALVQRDRPEQIRLAALRFGDFLLVVVCGALCPTVHG